MFGLIANVMTDHALRTGAKVHVLEYDGDIGRTLVTGLNKSGRSIEKYVSWKRLTDIRAAFIPEHLRKRTQIWWDDKASVQEVALELTQLWQFVRTFHPDGRLLKEGIPEGEAVREYLAKNNLPNYSVVAPIPSVGQRREAIRAAGMFYACDVKPERV